MKEYRIYLTRKGEERKDRIKRFFGISGFSVNGEAVVTIEDAATEKMLKETAIRGFIEIRNK